MELAQEKKNHNKGGAVVRYEPQTTQLLDSKPNFKEYFQRVGCYNLCVKLQGYHMDIAKEFALNFDGLNVKIGPLEFKVIEESISTATEIPT